MGEGGAFAHAILPTLLCVVQHWPMFGTQTPMQEPKRQAPRQQLPEPQQSDGVTRPSARANEA